MNSGIRILHLQSRRADERVEVMATSCPQDRKLSLKADGNHKLDNGMKMWKRNGNTTTLLFCLIRLEIVHQERTGQVKTIVMKHFNGILFHKSEPANKQHTKQPTNVVEVPTQEYIDVLNEERSSNVIIFFDLTGKKISVNYDKCTTPTIM